ncbi:MAG: recombinase family protein [Synergistaceae bacterium]|jgi:hypothetical protein|nr:recombinase family protein [Synergistaceae bacterium]
MPIGRRARKPQQIILEIPLESQATKRLQSISEQTGLSYYELLLKWLNDEEKAIQVQHDARDLLDWQKGIEAQLQRISVLLGEQNVGEKKAGDEKPDSDFNADPETDSSSPQSYRQQVQEKIQSLRKQGLTYSKIAAQFNAEGIATITGTGKWYPSSVSQLLKNFGV